MLSQSVIRYNFFYSFSQTLIKYVRSSLCFLAFDNSIVVFVSARTHAVYRFCGRGMMDGSRADCQLQQIGCLRINAADSLSGSDVLMLLCARLILGSRGNNIHIQKRINSTVQSAAGAAVT